MRPQDRRALVGAPAFRDLAPGELGLLAERAQVAGHARREAIVRAGETPSELVLMLVGRAALTGLGADGRALALRFLAPGDVVAAPGRVAPGGVHALTEARTARWPAAVVAELASAMPRWVEALERELTERAEEHATRLREASAQSVEQRLAHLLLRLARQAGRRETEGVRVDFPLTREDLAEMTGEAPFAVSRLLSEWTEQGLIEVGGGRVVVRSPSGLVERAESGS